MKNRPELAIALCELLGLNPGDVEKLEFSMDATGRYRVIVTGFFTTEIWQSAHKIIRTYDLNPELIHSEGE